MNEQIGPRHAPTTRTTVVALLQWLGFWGSVVLPASYLPILYTTSGAKQLLTFACAIIVNVACLIAGHQYHS